MTRRNFRTIAEDVLLIGLLFFAPVALGSVHTWAYSVIAIISLILFNLRFIGNIDSLKEVVKRPVSIVFFLLIGAVFFYIAPLPDFAVKILSPEAFNSREMYAFKVSKWQTLSVYPHATIVYLLKLASYTMVFLTVVSKMSSGVFIRESPNYLEVRSRSGFLYLGVLMAVLSILFHSLSDFNLHIPANALYFIALLAMATGFSGEKKRRFRDYFFAERLLNAVIIIGFIVAVLGIAQKLGAGGKIYWLIEMDGAHFGPYVNYDHYAGFMEMCAIVSVSFFMAHIATSSFTTIKRIKDKVVWFSSAEANKTLVYLFFSSVMGTALFLTTSRGGILSFTAALSVFFFMYLIALGRKRRNRILFAFVLIVLLASIMAAWIGPEETIDRFKLLNDVIDFFIKEKPILSELRPFIWKDTIELIRDFPLSGVGLGVFSYVFPKYRTFPADYGFLRYAHNDYLQFIGEMGLIGAIFIAGFFVWYFRRVRECLTRLRKS